MNYNNILIFKTKKDALKYIKSFNETETKLNDKTSIIKYFKNILSETSYNISGAVTVNLLERMIVRYEEGDEKETLSLFSVIEDTFNIESLYDEKDTGRNKTIAASLIFTYYILYSNFKKAADFLKILFNNENLLFNLYRYNSFDNDELSNRKNDIFTRALVVTLFAGRNNKDFIKGQKNLQSNYIENLRTLANKNRLVSFLDDKMIAMMHQKIMHDYFENNKGAPLIKYNGRGFVYSILDEMETKPSFLVSYISNFKTSSTDNCWGKIDDRSDYRVSSHLNEFDSNKERLIQIFKNYLYSTYALGQKYNKLEERILQMSSVLNVLGYHEYSIMDIIDGLPDKIQGAALKGLVGD